MFRLSSEDEFQTFSEGGTRFLFALDHFDFLDTLDGEGALHQFVIHAGEDEEEEPTVYETDAATLYELMARYLAGEYEKREYDLESSPGHGALLDVLEIATARARAGETEFSLAELEGDDYEDEELEEEEELEDDERPRPFE